MEERCVAGDCHEDADCDDGEICDLEEHTCGPRPTLCEEDADCGAGRVCEQGHCRAIEGPTCPEDQDCEGRACGVDPICGLSCGECGGGWACDDDGQCACAPQCGEQECGLDPVCGASCGDCGDAERCQAGRCVCAPDCADRECGLDPNCGTECGQCAQRESCSPDGECVCVPRCEGRECGLDPECGVSCGRCGPGQECTADGSCGPADPCPAAADCAGLECGPDPVCGVDCGACQRDESCQQGRCAPLGGDDACAAARPIQAPGQDAGSTNGAPLVERGSCGGNGAEAVRSFEAAADGCWRISTAGSTFDTVLYVRTDCGQADSEVGCNDDSDGLQSEVEVQARAGTTYYVFVDGYNAGAQGAYALSVQRCDVGPECPEIADCARRECGPDPVCGVDCGACPAGEGCNAAGLCVAGDPVCPAGADCAGLQCGPDPVCGVDCGACPPDQRCDGAGRCVGADPVCPADADCAGLQCGPDPICGVECGPCAPDQVCQGGACVGDPVGDACEQPTALDALGTVGANNEGAPAGQRGSCGGGGGELVWAYTAQQGGCLQLDTEGSAFDTVLYVRTDCGDAATQIECNDDSIGLQSSLEIDAEAGQTYYIFVDGYSDGARGEVVLNAARCGELPPVCPADADCAGLACGPDPVCGVECGPCGPDLHCEAGACVPDVVVDDPCEAIIPIERFGAYANDNRDAPAVHRGDCAGNGGEVLYAFMVDAPGCIQLDTAGSSFDTVLHVRTDCRDAATEVACNDDSGGLQSALEVEAQADTVYYVFVDGYSDASRGDIVLNVARCGEEVPVCPDDAACGALQCGPDPVCGVSCGECAADERCDRGACVPDGPPADACDAVTPIEAFGPHAGTTIDFPSLHRGSCAGNGPEAVWAFAVNGPGCIRLDTEGSNFDTVLHVRTECGDAATEVACNDDGLGMGLQSLLDVEVVEGPVYYVFVDGFSANSAGEVTLNVSVCD